MTTDTTGTSELIKRLRAAHAMAYRGSIHEACAEAADALEAAEAANRTRPDYNLRCDDCGRAHILDTSLPSETWNQIAEPGNVLCTTCIDARLAAEGLTAEAEFYYAGTALQSRMYGDQDALEAAERVIAPFAAVDKKISQAHLGGHVTADDKVLVPISHIRDAADWLARHATGQKERHLTVEEQDVMEDALRRSGKVVAVVKLPATGQKGGDDE